MSSPSADTPAPAGPVRVGGYTLLQRIGEGGMGVVHLARRDADGHRVALKVLRPQVVGDREARERLAREVSSLALVHSPRVAEVLDADPWAEVPFVVTRYVPGPSLHEHVGDVGPLVGPDLEWTALCLAEALAAVHDAGVLHRDVKPTNVLLEGRSPVLIDFGLARVADDPRLTHTGWLLGTPGYLAPEILYGDDATAASDVHSWAATLAFAGLGRAPFGGGPAMAVLDRVRRGEHDLSGLPSPLREVLRDCLHPDPAARPRLDQLLDWLHDRGGAPAPAATRLLPVAGPPPVEGAVDDGGAGDGDYWPWSEAEPVAARRPLAPRLRAGLLLVVLALLGGAAVAAYPWPATAGFAVLVALVSAGSRGQTVRRARREVRGRRWWDGPVAVLGAPWHLLASLPGSLLLMAWACGCGAAAALLAYAGAADPSVLLGMAGLAGTVGLWLGPGASRVRGPVGGAAARIAGRSGPWLLVLLALAGLAAALAASVAARGTDWTPATDDPLTRLREALDGVALLDRIAR